MDHLLEIKNLSYYYQDGDYRRDIFKNVSLAFDAKQFYAILGDSGSGKTTFLSVIAGLDRRFEGDVCYKNQSIREIGLDKYRRSGVAMIYQNYNLIPHLNAVENCMIAADISENVKYIYKEEIETLLASFGIRHDKSRRKISSLSGGEQQRVAIARAIITQARIIVADEPTGNLDNESADVIMNAFLSLAHEQQKCIIMVTHNKDLAALADCILEIDALNKNICQIKKY